MGEKLHHGVPGGPKARCPRDGRLMERIGIGDHVIDRCSACGALWFDAREIQAVLRRKEVVQALDIGGMPEEAKSAGRALGDLHCPRDNSPLIKVKDPDQPHITMDSCTVCHGVLLDAGELADLSEVTLGERLRRFFG